MISWLTAALLTITSAAAAAATNHECARDCLNDSEQRTCVFDFELKYYNTMSRACGSCPNVTDDCFNEHCVYANGLMRPVAIVNKQLPGPSIEVCLNDQIVINFMNRLQSDESSTLHIHGFHQRGTGFMDGVPYVTQCPVRAGEDFRYAFQAKQEGTYFWHTHAGFQRGDGAAGMLIVRPRATNLIPPLAHELDGEFPLLVQDWTRHPVLTQFADHHYSGGLNDPEFLLLNGKGFTPNSVKSVPVERFDVKQGGKYRFRVASNGFLQCPIEMRVQQHQMRIIALDGEYVEDGNATLVDVITLYAGERVDFILESNQPVASYWIHLRGLIDCKAPHAYQTAQLVYSGSRQQLRLSDIAYDSDFIIIYDNNGDLSGGKKNEVVFQQLNQNASEFNILPTDLRRWQPSPTSKSASPTPPDVKFLLKMDFKMLNHSDFHSPSLYPIDQSTFWKRLHSPQFNNISSLKPNVNYLTQYNEIPKGDFCDQQNLEKCGEEVCHCIHRLRVPVGSVVELVLIEEGRVFDATHPIHLHGYSFEVVGMGRIKQNLTSEEVFKVFTDESLRTVKNGDGVLKDSIAVFDGGYTIVRFKADNSGPWLMHCHLGWHDKIGMEMIVQVGEPTDWNLPPEGFPRCGSWKMGDAPYQTSSSAAVADRNWLILLVITTLFILQQRIK